MCVIRFLIYLFIHIQLCDCDEIIQTIYVNICVYYIHILTDAHLLYIISQTCIYACKYINKLKKLIYIHRQAKQRSHSIAKCTNMNEYDLNIISNRIRIGAAFFFIYFYKSVELFKLNARSDQQICCYYHDKAFNLVYNKTQRKRNV